MRPERRRAKASLASCGRARRACDRGLRQADRRGDGRRQRPAHQPVARVDDRQARADDRPPDDRGAGPDRGVRGHADPCQARRLRRRSSPSTSATEVKKGQVLAELRVPEVEADAQAEAGDDRAGRGRAETRPRRPSRSPRPRSPAPRRRSRRSRPASSGPRRTLARWQSEFTRIEQLFRERAQTGSLLDETRNKLDGGRGDPRGGPGPGQDRPRPPSPRRRPALDKARSDVRPPPSQHRGRPLRGRARRGDGELHEDRRPLRRRRDPPQRRHRPPDDARRRRASRSSSSPGPTS